MFIIFPSSKKAANDDDWTGRPDETLRNNSFFLIKAVLVSFFLHLFAFMLLVSCNKVASLTDGGSGSKAVNVSLIAGEINPHGHLNQLREAKRDNETIDSLSLSSEENTVETLPELTSNDNYVPDIKLDTDIVLKKEQKNEAAPEVIRNNSVIKSVKKSPGKVKKNGSQQQKRSSNHGSSAGSSSGGEAGDGQNAQANAYLKANYDYIQKRIKTHLRYSPQAKRIGLKGTATVSFVIDFSGKASNIKIGKSSGHALLDESAVNAVISASPFPAPPAPAKIIIPITFNLK